MLHADRNTSLDFLIYQVPKAGSQTVQAILDEHAVGDRVHRFHYLSRTNTRALKRFLRRDCGDETWRRDQRAQLERISTLRRLILCRRLASALGFRISKLLVITAVRDIIGLALAAIFENHSLFVPTVRDLSPAVCREALMRPRFCPRLRQWFDTEMRPVLGINVFSKPFSPETGFAVYENRFARVLLYRFDALPKLPLMFREFLGWEVSSVPHVNGSHAKPYAKQYEQVRNELCLPEEFVAEQLECKLMRHFYSQEERAAFATQYTSRRFRRPSEVDLAQSCAT